MIWIAHIIVISAVVVLPATATPIAIVIVVVPIIIVVPIIAIDITGAGKRRIRIINLPNISIKKILVI